VSYDPLSQQTALLTQSVALQQQTNELLMRLLQQMTVLNLLASDGFPIVGTDDLVRDVERTQ
jgi:hypothetical protein